ncbi:hypothetical protein Tco_0168571, partial [Tanacetum coccineum]
AERDTIAEREKIEAEERVIEEFIKMRVEERKVETKLRSCLGMLLFAAALVAVITFLRRLSILELVEVLQKSCEELKEARARDKELFEEAKEENIKQYKEKLEVSCLDNEGRNGKRSECKDCQDWLDKSTPDVNVQSNGKSVPN